MSNVCFKCLFETNVSGRVKARTNATQDETRQALLEASGAVFAEQGYRSTTVREICRRARANVAAINYHFGGKERLYLEVIRDAHTRATAKFPFDLEVGVTDSPELRLRAFVRSFLFRIFDTGPTAWMGKLIAMEMVNPSVALEPLVQERVRPMAEQIGRLVTEILGKKATPRQVRLCGFSLVSQCVFYAHCRSVVERLYPEQKFDRNELEHLANHIVRFSLAGLRDSARASRPPRKAARP